MTYFKAADICSFSVTSELYNVYPRGTRYCFVDLYHSEETLRITINDQQVSALIHTFKFKFRNGSVTTTNSFKSYLDKKNDADKIKKLVDEVIFKINNHSTPKHVYIQQRTLIDRLMG